MKRLRDLPISSKLLILFLLSSSIALLVAVSLIVVYDLINYSQQKVADMTIQTEVLGKTSTAALAFNDSKSATEYLAALQANPSVIAAALYTTTGQRFATYSRDGATHDFPNAGAPGHEIADGNVMLFRAIEQNGERVGTVYLRGSLLQMQRLLSYAGIILLAIACSLVIALWASTRLQQVVAAPILDIAGVARGVIDNKDYTLRVNNHGHDEIGSLAIAFNHMLDHIQARDAMLLATNESLQNEVAERKQVQAMLTVKMAELDRSNKELQEFAYVASHDLRAPLRAIDSLSQWLDEDLQAALVGDSRVQMNLLRGRVRRMDNLLTDLLDYARVGKTALEIQEIDIAAVLTEAVELSNIPAGFEVKFEPKLPMVTTARLPLQRIFMNLIGNAIKHHDRKEGSISIAVIERADELEFIVADDGPGIADKFHEKIFRMFQTLKPRDTLEGSGMGLALVRKLVEAAGGKVWIESHLGRGAIFHFTWPTVWKQKIIVREFEEFRT